MFAVIVLTALCCSTAYARSRIVGGVEAESGEFPHQVSLESCYQCLVGGFFCFCGDFRHICGASIIDDYWVVTAAHCVTNENLDYYRLKYDLHDISSGEGKEANVQNIIPHEGYNNGQGTFANDIALMKTVEKLPNENKISLAATGDYFDGKECVISGWGLTDGSASVLPNKLQKTTGLILSEEECANLYGSNSINAGHICFHDIGQSGACNGDSGGPMVCDGKLAGVTSWGTAGCTTANPSVYSRITYFRNWLDETMRRN